MLTVIYVRIPPRESYPELLSALERGASPELLREVEAFRNPGRKVCRLLGEALVRHYLRSMEASPNSREVKRGEKGKPYFVGVDHLFFNISHSGDYVVASFSDREVGVDIERRRVARMEVARRFFHPEERRHLQEMETSERDHRFFDYWSIKESYLKYTGTGLTRPLSTFRVALEQENIRLYEQETPLPLFVYPCLIDQGYACFVCGESTQPPVVREVEIARLL